MGYLRAADMIEFAGPEAAMVDHLNYNLYPPSGFPAEVALEAARAVADDEGSRVMEGVYNGVSTHSVTALELVEGLHLEAFVSYYRLLEVGGEDEQ